VKAAAFYLFLLHLRALFKLAVPFDRADIVPFRFFPVRVARWRGLTLSLVGLGVLAIMTLAKNFECRRAPSPSALCNCGLCRRSDAAIRLARSFRALSNC